MPTFSQRYGYTPIEKAFQREEVGNELRTALWNFLNTNIWSKPGYQSLVDHVWIHHFNSDIDALRVGSSNSAIQQIKQRFFKLAWFGVYDFVEFLIQSRVTASTRGMCDAINEILQKENAAYRVINNEIVEITDSNEIKGIEEALKHPDSPVRIHIQTALSMLSDRTSPDYRNSIKESISAVEAACRLVTGLESASLGEALKKIHGLHPALSRGFSALYGFTSDEGGIRHSLIDESNLSYADAKFMLVSCSAFVSYLRTITSGN